MNTIQHITAGISLALCLAFVAPDTYAQQGKGQAKKEAAQAADDQETGNKNQKGKSGQARGKNRQNGSTPEDPPAVLRKEGGQGNSNKVNKANRDNQTNNNNNNNNNIENDENGNAYGKNKGSLSGREFGQQRAAQARLTGEQRRERLDNRVDDGDKKAREARTKIARAREELEEDRKENKLTDAQYNEKKARIDRAERAVQVLEQKVNEGRALGSLQ